MVRSAAFALILLASSPAGAAAEIRGEVTYGAMKVTGTLGRTSVRRHLKRNVARVTRCYESERIARPTLGGKVTARFVIDRSGRVTSATAKGVDAAVSSCIAEVIRGLEFPEPTRGNTRVVIVMTLTGVAVPLRDGRPPGPPGAS